MSLIYISDTNIWIDFRNAGLLEQMFKLPFTLCCTDFVLYELEDIFHDELLAQGLLVESFDERDVQKLLNLKIEHGNSSMADVSCYLLALTTGRPLLTGDGKLRRQAQKDGIQVRGALWLLDLMIEHYTITSSVAAQALENMLWHGARLPGAECESRLSRWREPDQD
ncbi:MULTISPECIES: type II toxin-antitoxin system VapC family toxin [Pseudomonas fluorescens group]|uniref:Type II toxin-antitoxin system VapC family toxin n=1 Tax=Pseudomonas petroselini TaxID=2899822 RepID=A0ABS8R1U4_9PSED|nr:MULTISPECIES: type II toxin-antitoxin system VapC family toxin [Pseudomonas fluorescens group]MCD7041950.1 type II toxin-antitoxin system VapC family toxin [Pseudomonas petroselini]MCD7046838.1 type II toxin-antitoxin system VapC family toxin [Pseudomonas petroselini]MCD7067564.1 type II toxin-antitoxin system VapC family toxin [Pseudomonas petroselini]MCD7082022.1 type II toxin-antitoxin system VapC family toxin [Pseudomonas petroselini]MCF5665011.1 type II toxin-antitoxin system VapC fami